MGQMSETTRPRRSVLYMPGSKERALEKAKTLAADALILDLEDAVAPSAKEEAREMVCAAVAAGGYGQRELAIRVNGLDTPWGKDDMAAAFKARPHAILVPKVSTLEDMAEIRAAFAGAKVGGAIALWVMMETPLAMLNARDIAGVAKDAHAPLACMIMGTNDLAKETGASLGENRFAMIPWLATCVAAAKANGLSIIDGVYNDFRNIEGLEAECRQGRSLGMDGKTLIHPGQLDTANAVFAPSDEEVERARTIIAAFELPENAGKGAIEIDGRMVELLHREIASRTVAMADAIAAMN
jgi:citrate lyase subunit beta/citryl-CoA lyase